jgi:hypothetical protein
MATAKTQQEGIVVYPPNIVRVKVGVEEYSGSPGLLTHNRPDDLMTTLEKANQGKAKDPKKAKPTPQDMFHSSMYNYPGDNGTLGNGKRKGEKQTPCVPATFPKRATREAARSVAHLTMAETMTLFFCNGLHHASHIELLDTEPQEFKQLVPNQNKRGSLAVCYRTLYQGWRAKFYVDFLEDRISLEQMINLINRGGFQYGWGSWRAGKGGPYGQYKITEVAEVE